MTLFLLFRLSQLLVPIILIPIYVRILGEDVYSRYIAYGAIATLFSTIVNLNLETVNLRKLSEKFSIARIKFSSLLIFDRVFLYFALVSFFALAITAGIVELPLYSLFVIDPILFNSFYPNAVLMTYNRYFYVFTSYLLCKISFILLILLFDSFYVALFVHYIFNVIFVCALNTRLFSIVLKRYQKDFHLKPTLVRIKSNCKSHYRLILQKLIQLNVICPKLIISIIAPTSALIVFEISEKLYNSTKILPSVLYQYTFSRVDKRIGLIKIVSISLGYMLITVFTFSIMKNHIEAYFSYGLDMTPYILFVGSFFSSIYLFQGKINLVKYGDAYLYEKASLFSSILGLLLLPIVGIYLSDGYIVPTWIALCEMSYCLVSVGATYVRR